MRAVRFVDGLVTVVDVDRPAGGPDDVVVEVAGVGICGSDLHLLDSAFAPTVTIGHEIAGTTADGRAVAIEPLMPCGTCETCRGGAAHLCPTGSFEMLGLGRDGGMAEALVVPERALVPLASGIDLADASLVEPLAVAVHGLGLAGHTRALRTVVIGAGTIGLCAAAAVRATGGAVDVVARHPHQRDAAAALGAGTEPGGEYDLVIETAGTASALRAAVRLARPGATILMLSIHWEPTPTPGAGLWMKELRIVTSMTYGTRDGIRDIDRAAAILAADPAIGAAVITHRLPLDRAAEGFALARDRAAGSIKVLLQP